MSLQLFRFKFQRILFHYFQKYHSVSNLNEMDQFKQNALHIACASGFTGLIKYLIDQGGIDYMAQDFNGNTCLHMGWSIDFDFFKF